MRNEIREIVSVKNAITTNHSVYPRIQKHNVQSSLSA